MYKWSDILALAKGNPHAPILCFEFADTELLPTPMSFGDVQKMLVAAGRKPNQLVGPIEISHELYLKLYAQTGNFGSVQVILMSIKPKYAEQIMRAARRLRYAAWRPTWRNRPSF